MTVNNVEAPVQAE